MVVWVVGYSIAYSVIALVTNPGYRNLGDIPFAAYLLIRVMALAGVQAYLLPRPLRASAMSWFIVTTAVGVALLTAYNVLLRSLLPALGTPISVSSAVIFSWPFIAIALLLCAQWRWIISDYVDRGLWIWLIPAVFLTYFRGNFTTGVILDVIRATNLEPGSDIYTLMGIAN
ncbi:MAG: hypothetical protein AAF125_08790, partial [Chloroflexota bacterium]